MPKENANAKYSTKVPYSGSATTPHVAVVPLHPLKERKGKEYDSKQNTT